MTFPALYAVVVGLLIFGQWAFFLITRQVPELKAERVRAATQSRTGRPIRSLVKSLAT